MPEPADVLVRIRGVTKDYRGLRPLRIRELDLRRGQSLALLGFDAAMAEVLVNMLTGGVLPDAGDVSVFGRPTAEITDPESWLQLLDRFGLVSERALLLDQLTAEQNLAIPLTLAVESMTETLRRNVHRIADEVGVARHSLQTRVGELPADVRLRIRLGRALALEPHVLLAEHPSASVTADEALQFAADVGRISRARSLAVLVMTADRAFAGAVADEVLMLHPATGELKPPAGWERWLRFGRSR